MAKEHTTIRIDKEVKKYFTKKSKLADRSLSYIINKILIKEKKREEEV